MKTFSLVSVRCRTALSINPTNNFYCLISCRRELLRTKTVMMRMARFWKTMQTTTAAAVDLALFLRRRPLDLHSTGSALRLLWEVAAGIMDPPTITITVTTAITTTTRAPLRVTHTDGADATRHRPSDPTKAKAILRATVRVDQMVNSRQR